MMEERPLIFRAVNAPLIASVVLLTVYGSVVVSSAVSSMSSGPSMLKRHLFGIGLGLVFMAVAWAFDYRKLEGWAGPLMALSALLIVSPRILGFLKVSKAISGSYSWLSIGKVRLFQPSEPAKLVVIVVLAAVIARYGGKIERPADVARICGFAAVPFVLILTQPDLGTGFVFIAIAVGMMLIGGLQPKWFLVLALAGVLLVGGLFAAESIAFRVTGDHNKVIPKHQMDRLTVFFDPSADSANAGFHVQQSKIAIGSGELSGKGLRAGTQGNLYFLPERHTDFIFSVLGEELGFVGAIVLLGLYLALLVTAMSISASSRDLFGALIVAGVCTMWLFQILENIGMTIGVVPVTGIPLPFMSYGASFMVTNMTAIGMLLSVWTRRY